MIQTHSHDPNVAAAAGLAYTIIEDVMRQLPPASSFDYGGHQLQLSDYAMCERCTRPIAEAQQIQRAIEARIDDEPDETIKEHLAVAAELMIAEAEAAIIRAELHNGQATEPILNSLLGYLYDRGVNDSYDHHHGDNRVAKP